MLYTNEMIKNLGYDSVEDFITVYVNNHQNCCIRYMSNGVYLDYDFDSKVYKNEALSGDNMICNKSEDIELLVPYINLPVYIKGFCWNKKFDGWAIIHYNNKKLPSSRDLLFDYRGNTYSVYGFLPSRFIMSTSSDYHNAIYKEQIN